MIVTNFSNKQYQPNDDMYKLLPTQEKIHNETKISADRASIQIFQVIL